MGLEDPDTSREGFLEEGPLELTGGRVCRPEGWAEGPRAKMASQAHLRWDRMGKAVRKDHREALVSLRGHVPYTVARSHYGRKSLEFYVQ